MFHDFVYFDLLLKIQTHQNRTAKLFSYSEASSTSIWSFSFFFCEDILDLLRGASCGFSQQRLNAKTGTNHKSCTLSNFTQVICLIHLPHTEYFCPERLLCKSSNGKRSEICIREQFVTRMVRYGTEIGNCDFDKGKDGNVGLFWHVFVVTI